MIGARHERKVSIHNNGKSFRQKRCPTCKRKDYLTVTYSGEPICPKCFRESL